MTAMSFSCYICSKNLTITDDIVSIQCGHVFHAACLKQSHKERTFSIFKTPKCPQCLAEIKTTFKLNLNFEISDKDHQINELKSEVNHRYHMNYQLHCDLEEKKEKFEKIEDQYKKSCEETKRLTKKVKELTIVITQLNNMKKQFEQKDAQIKELSLKNEKLSEQIKNYSKEVAIKTASIRQLKEGNELMSLELAKKICHSTKLVKEKDAEQNISVYSKPHSQQDPKNNHVTNEKKKSQAAKEKEHANSVSNEQHSNTTIKKKRHQSKIEGISNHQVGETTIAATKIETKTNKCTTATGQENIDKAQSATIECIGETITDEAAAKKYIHQLSKLMDFALNENDITKVSCAIKGKNTLLFVTFKSAAIKSNFLSKKHQLAKQNHKKLKNVYIYDFVSEKTLDLYEKAKSLKLFGFKHVYYENDVVYVKRNPNSFPVTISDLSHIETIKSGVKVFSALKS